MLKKQTEDSTDPLSSINSSVVLSKTLSDVTDKLVSLMVKGWFDTLSVKMQEEK